MRLCRLSRRRKGICHLVVSLEKYAEAVFNKGAPLSNCFGFVDGTVIQRPQTGIQRPQTGTRIKISVRGPTKWADCTLVWSSREVVQITMLMKRKTFKIIVKKVSTNFLGFSMDCPRPHPHSHPTGPFSYCFSPSAIDK